MGIYAFIAGVVAIVVAFLFGRKNGSDTTKTKISGEVTIERERAEKAEQKADLAQDVTETIVELATSQRASSEEIAEAESRLDIARRQRDVDAAIEIAKRLAQIAKERK